MEQKNKILNFKFKYKLFCTILLLFYYRDCNSQSLVPNGDFETFSTCPIYSGQITLASPWMITNICGNYSDYFNQCSTSGAVGVPYNTMGYQFPHSGFGYAGLIPWHTLPNYREYIEVPLIDSLKANFCYHFEMYVNQPNNCRYAIEDVSAYFSNTIVTGVSGCQNLPFHPQITNPNGFITDTLNWTLISGDYTALGGESYLIIGNFKKDGHTNTLLVDSNVFYPGYIYIDDVSLTLSPPCNTGISDYNHGKSVHIYPNPFINNLNIEVNDYELTDITLFDISSRKLFEYSFSKSISVNTEHLANGIYIYQISNKSGVVEKGKLMKY